MIKGVQMNKTITLIKQAEIGGLMAVNWGFEIGKKRRFNGGRNVFPYKKKSTGELRFLVY